MHRSVQVGGSAAFVEHDLGRQLFACRDESHRDRVYTVPNVLVGKSFTKENVAKVSFTVSARDFGPNSVRILVAIHGTGNLVFK